MSKLNLSLISCMLAWHATHDGGPTDGFTVYWGEKPGVYTDGVDVGPNTKHVVPLDSGKAMYAMVRGYNGAGESSDSNVVRLCQADAPRLSVCPSDSELLGEVERLKRDATALRAALAKAEAKTATYANYGNRYRAKWEDGNREGERLRAALDYCDLHRYHCGLSNFQLVDAEWKARSALMECRGK